jgi:cysteine synthase
MNTTLSALLDLSSSAEPPAAQEVPAPPPRAANALPSLIGNTPVLWVSEPLAPAGRGFWAKLEGANPGGIKDRPGLHMVAAARARGDLPEGGRIIESTSGTLGLGLALAGLALNHPVTLVADPGLEPSMRRLLRSHGTELEIVSEPHPVGGWQQARRERVAQLREQQPYSWCPDQYNNPDNVAAYSRLALELAAQLGRVDVLVCSVGTGGHSAGVYGTLRYLSPGVRLVGVDTVGSTIFGQPARPRLMRGLGSSIYPRNVDYGAFSEVHWVAPAEAVWSCRALARSQYVSGGWSVGAVALVAGWLARTCPPDTRIAAVFPDGPHRYLETVFDDEYCAAHGLLAGPPAADPDEIGHPLAAEVRRWTRCTQVVDPLTATADAAPGGGSVSAATAAAGGHQ